MVGQQKTLSPTLDPRNLEMEAENPDLDGSVVMTLILQDARARSPAISLWNVRISLP